MEGCQLKYILKAIKLEKEKVLANILLLLLIKDGFLKSRSCVYLKFDHVYNCYFASNLKNIVSYYLVQTLNVSHDVM